MGRYSGEREFRHDAMPKAGVLLSNLGTPAAPTPAAVRRYLAEFLADPRIVEMPRPLWRLILHGIILRTRPRKSAEAYAKIWTEAGSPLLTISQRQADALRRRVQDAMAGPVEVVLGMRYGAPSIAHALDQLRDAGVRRLLVLPLYPQYSGSTTGSTFDAVSAVLQRWRWVPELRFVQHYHDAPLYISALANRILRYWDEHGRGAQLIFSFHGLPRRNFLAGDPYFCECQKTARLVAEQLQLDDDQWTVAFQSRFGWQTWLQPYLEPTLRKLPAQGVRAVDVVCPGFAADCLETLEEIAMRGREVFLETGGERFHYIPALNDEPEHITALVDLVLRHVQGWPEAADWDEAAARAEGQARLERARALGAER